MPKEDPRNFGLVCPEHTPKPDHSLVHGRPLESFIGHFVKKGFACKHPLSGLPSQEHMWVEVKEIKDGAFVGELTNDPACELDEPMAKGDTVTVQTEEVEMVLPPSNG